MKRFICCLCIFSCLITGCSNEQVQNVQEEQEETVEYDIQETEENGIPVASGESFSMDTYMSIKCYGNEAKEAVEAGLKEIDRLNNSLSVGVEGSEIAIINTNGSGKVSEDGATLIKESLELYKRTNGAFDITIYPLMVEWGFTTGNFKVPSENTISSILKKVGSDKINFDGETVTLEEGQGIDLGGIAKGYTSSNISKIFETYDITSAMISLGGNVQLYGKKIDGSLWKVGIQDPEDENNFLGILQASDTAIITSGGYERNFVDEETGNTYHHILDPTTGYSANNGLISVTIVSENGMLADGLSTSFYVMGLEQSIAYWQEYGSDFDMILMDEDQNVYITENLENNFTSNFNVQVIKKEK